MPETQPTPDHVFQALNAYQLSAALKGAIELDLFTAIAEGKRTAPEIAERCAASTRGIRILADYLTVTGFLLKEGERYSLPPDSAAFLNRRSPAYLGSIAEFMVSPEMLSASRDMAAVVRKGGTLLPDQGTVTDAHPAWVAFARGMAPLMAMPARLIAESLDVAPDQKLRVLDIAAGHGLFGINIARRYPNAQIVALDWKAVLEVAIENAKNAGVSDRFSTIEGSAFDVDFGGPYDVVLLSNFIHHFEPSVNETLLKKVRNALADGGRAMTLEFVPNDDRVSPPPAATFGLIMLVTTPKGDAYTFKEFQKMFANAGFSRSEIKPLPPTPESLITSYR